MKSRTDLINFIAAKIGAKSYVEIGVFNPDHNFNHINVEHKIGVDPDPNAKAIFRGTSDEFFKFFKAVGTGVDLVFIDGLHHADQVKKDIKNAWDIMNGGGAIILHDCNPPTEQTTCVPRGAQREWCGDTYRAVISILSPEFFTVDFDYGCTVIRNEWLVDTPLDFTEEILNTDWKSFEQKRKSLLNLVSIDEAKKIIDSWN